MPELDGKVAVITGALGLLGRAHCAAFARAGATVVATDLDHAECKSLATQIGGEALGFGADITDERSMFALRDAILGRFRRIDVLLNNAAVNDAFHDAESSRFEEFSTEAFERSMRVNVTGTFLACRILGAVMAARGSGSIINVASTYGLVGPDQSIYRRPDGSQTFFKSPAYGASKGAVIALTRFLAAYWGSRGVRVNSLCPGGVRNGQDDFFIRNYASRTPLGRMGLPDEIAAAAIFLASDSSTYMTGTDLVVDGGWTAW